MFVAQGGSFAISSLCWGYLCDKKIKGNTVAMMGTLYTSISFLFLGPISFIPIDSNLKLTIAMLILQGIGMAAQLVAGLSISYRAGK